MPPVQQTGWFSDWVTERSNGELIVKWIGGPEIIPGINQPEAVRIGSIDVAMFPSTFYESYVPEAYGITLTEDISWEQRETGLYDYMVKVHKEKMGIYYLGRPQSNEPFYTYLNVPVTKPQEIAGLKIGITGGTGEPFLTALGASSVFIASPEMYSAVERGVVDGFIMPVSSVPSQSLYEVTRYMVDHPYYQGNLVLLMNLDKWNSLPEHLQRLITEVMIDVEKEGAEYGHEVTTESRQKCLDSGMEAIRFSPADAEWYVDLAHSSLWEYWKEKLSPEAYNKLRELTIKK